MKTNLILSILTAFIAVSCSDKYEIVEPQTLKYEVTGENYFAVVYDPNAPKAPYMLEDHRQIFGVFEVPAKIGDSVDVMVMAGGTPWDIKPAGLVITLGTDTVYKGETKELISVRGTLGRQLFVERKNK